MELRVKIGDRDILVEEDVLRTTDFGTSVYGFKFDESAPGWTGNIECDLMYLKIQQQYANDLLRARGYLFLNELYSMLGVPKTKLGAVTGWVYDPHNPVGDNYVDLDIYHERNEGKNVFILDPNVDGFILDKI